jgi:hypothetical protein
MPITDKNLALVKSNYFSGLVGRAGFRTPAGDISDFLGIRVYLISSENCFSLSGSNLYVGIARPDIFAYRISEMVAVWFACANLSNCAGRDANGD